MRIASNAPAGGVVPGGLSSGLPIGWAAAGPQLAGSWPDQTDSRFVNFDYYPYAGVDPGGMVITSGGRGDQTTPPLHPSPSKQGPLGSRPLKNQGEQPKDDMLTGTGN